MYELYEVMNPMLADKTRLSKKNIEMSLFTTCGLLYSSNIWQFNQKLVRIEYLSPNDVFKLDNKLPFNLQSHNF